jgi:hypothetical protein
MRVARISARLLKNGSWVVSAVAFVIFAPKLNAYAAQRTHFIQGTVLYVQEQRAQSPGYTVGGSNPSDAPLTSSYYVFEVSLRADCEIYTGRYETALNYLPLAFSAGRSISVRLTRHILYFDLPDAPEMKMGIVRRKDVCASNR